MSDDVHYKGKLIPIPIPKDTTRISLMRELLRYQYENAGLIDDIAEDEDEFIIQFKDAFYRRYIILNDILYEVESHRIGTNDVFSSHEYSDGSIEFEVQYYNGGMSFDEAIHVSMCFDDVIKPTKE